MEYLEKILEQLEIPYTANTMDCFRDYMDYILELNEQINLTAIRDRGDFVNKHYVDSVLCADFPAFRSAKKVIDLGTGAGFPGMPLAFLYPDKEFILIDSLAKKLKIIEQYCHKMEISNVTVMHGRAEDLGHGPLRESCDVCLSRAVAGMAVLAEYCLPLVRKGGWLLAYKGPEGVAEMETAKDAIRALGGNMREIREISPENSGLAHNIICIEKVKKTPPIYPRKAGTPSKNPLK